MILHKKEQISINQPNIIMLDSKEGDYIYLHAYTYAQAIQLNDKFLGDIEKLKSTLEVGENQNIAITYFYNNAPEPIKILAPFLGLIHNHIELHQNLRELCGVLHMLSMVIHFHEYILLPKDIRGNFNINERMIMGYEHAWESLFITIKSQDRTTKENTTKIEDKPNHNKEEFKKNKIPTGKMEETKVRKGSYEKSIVSQVEDKTVILDNSMIAEEAMLEEQVIFEEEIQFQEEMVLDENDAIEHEYLQKKKLEEESIDLILKKMAGVNE